MSARLVVPGKLSRFSEFSQDFSVLPAWGGDGPEGGGIGAWRGLPSAAPDQLPGVPEARDGQQVRGPESDPGTSQPTSNTPGEGGWAFTRSRVLWTQIAKGSLDALMCVSTAIFSTCAGCQGRI